jgi:hypothetical protein
MRVRRRGACPITSGIFAILEMGKRIYEKEERHICVRTI